MSTNESNPDFSNITGNGSTSKLSTSGKLLIGLTGGVAVGLSIVCYPFVAPALRKHCLPYVPATTKQIANVLASIEKSRAGGAHRLLDIGSGDGRIVIAAAREVSGLEAHGVELNPWLVYYSRLAALREGVLRKTKFYRKDLWQFDISGYDNVVIFGVEQMMADLEQKVRKEVKPGSTIVACRFPFPTLIPNKTIDDGIDSVWVYKNVK
ncbi:ATP synthase subunit C lysine N-methyltransferase [Uranotaenia lowii]|uniref:ATP synthase subunit C lysine N-methyltransferase n=1 Tax=Uranotaenia lowii TaxID=190385 RepID=UPI00247A4D2E|nr:ATP synthase subunit C lysine N-methyltransferase [Uranotaenia lowii]